MKNQNEEPPSTDQWSATEAPRTRASNDSGGANVIEERFAWDQLIAPWTMQVESKKRNLIFIHIDAVMPILKEAPRLTRFEYDIAEHYEG